MVKKIFIIIGIVITLFCIGYTEQYNEKMEAKHTIQHNVSHISINKSDDVLTDWNS